MFSKIWTTVANYRETQIKVQRRKAEDRILVEMKATAFFAVAQFRNVQFAQLLDGGYDVNGSERDSRLWNSQTPVREKLFGWLLNHAFYCRLPNSASEVNCLLSGQRPSLGPGFIPAFLVNLRANKLSCDLYERICSCPGG
jgi:hypothetical protein